MVSRIDYSRTLPFPDCRASGFKHNPSYSLGIAGLGKRPTPHDCITYCTTLYYKELIKFMIEITIHFHEADIQIPVSIFYQVTEWLPLLWLRTKALPDGLTRLDGYLHTITFSMKLERMISYTNLYI